MTEAEARKAAEQRGWRLKKRGKVFRVVDENGTVVVGDWAKPPDYHRLTLGDIAKALEPPARSGEVEGAPYGLRGVRMVSTTTSTPGGVTSVQTVTS
jgi:hypothetical protein